MLGQTFGRSVRSVDTPPHKEAMEHMKTNEEHIYDHYLTWGTQGLLSLRLLSGIIVPPVVSSGADNKAISIGEANVRQVSRMTQKTFVFGLKNTYLFYTTSQLRGIVL